MIALDYKMRYAAKLIQKHHFLTKSGVFSFLCQTFLQKWVGLSI